MGHPIKAVTIDQYITHVAGYLVTNEHILSGGKLQSRRFAMLLAGYTASDGVGIPLRLRQTIPMTHHFFHHVSLGGHDAHGRDTSRLTGGSGDSLWPVPLTRRVPFHG